MYIKIAQEIGRFILVRVDGNQIMEGLRVRLKNQELIELGVVDTQMRS